MALFRQSFSFLASSHGVQAAFKGNVFPALPVPGKFCAVAWNWQFSDGLYIVTVWKWICTLISAFIFLDTIFKTIPLNVPVLNSMPLKQLRQGIQENSGNWKCFRNPLCQHSYLQGCVLTVRAGAGDGSTLGSSNPKLVVNLNPLVQN